MYKKSIIFCSVIIMALLLFFTIIINQNNNKLCEILSVNSDNENYELIDLLYTTSTNLKKKGYTSGKIKVNNDLLKNAYKVTISTCVDNKCIFNNSSENNTEKDFKNILKIYKSKDETVKKCFNIKTEKGTLELAKYYEYLEENYYIKIDVIYKDETEKTEKIKLKFNLKETIDKCYVCHK